ncbi:MAG TPA: hypothetical protein GX692_07610 [Acholeplasmataceae bacterium]|nr:hypothetical protein [Acholeplasmataceae bacterium]
MDPVMAIVLFANPWSMEDEKTGQRREGVTVEYVISENLKPVVNEDGSVGFKPYKESLHISKMPQVIKVPGIYEMYYGFSNIKGKPVMKLQGMKFVSEV